MKIDTYLFGSFEVDPEKIISFPNGLPGLENSTRFTLVHEADASGPASYTLQGIDNPVLALQIVDPVTLGFNYELDLSDAEMALLQSPAPEEVAVMLVLFKKEQGGKVEIAPNLRAPLLINTRARVGLQKIMQTMRPNITLSNLVSEV